MSRNFFFSIIAWFRLGALAVLQLTIASSFMYGAEVRYDVDFGGTAFSGHVLRVTGTITAETTTDSIVTSDLKFIHDGDQLSLPALPELFGFELGYQWDAELESLAFLRTPQSPGQESELAWQVDNNAAKLGLYLGSGTTPHYLLYSVAAPADFDQVIILDAMAPDSRPFVIGKAVPEPFTTILAVLGLLGITCFSRISRSSDRCREARR